MHVPQSRMCQKDIAQQMIMKNSQFIFKKILFFLHSVINGFTSELLQKL